MKTAGHIIVKINLNLTRTQIQMDGENEPQMDPIEASPDQMDGFEEMDHMDENMDDAMDGVIDGEMEG